MSDLKVVALEKAIQRAELVAKANDFSVKQEQVVKLLTASCKPMEIEGGKYIVLEQLKNFISNFQRAIRVEDSSFLMMKRGRWVDRVVGVEEFVESPQYMDQKGYLRPAIKNALIDFFANDYFVEAVTTGGIGIGKNYFADMALAYMLYRLSTYFNPQLEFDLAPGSSIIFIQQSKTLTLAKKVVFEQFSERLKLSSYFMNHFRFDPEIKSELRFPKQITVLPVGGSDTSVLGMNVYGGIIDELNFMVRVEDSVETRYTGEREYDQAEKLYTTLIRRMTSRFDQMGKLPGRLLLVSSRHYPGDFTGRKMDEAKEEVARTGKTTIFIMNYALWESPPSPVSDEKFLVEVGDEQKQSRIIESRKDARDPEDVIEVPVNYLNVFRRDIDAALRDIGGIVTGTKKPFIPYRELIVKAQEEYQGVTSGKTLFKAEEIVLDQFFLGEMATPDWGRLVDVSYVDDVIMDRSQVFAAHIDVGLSQDAAGLAVGRIVGYKVLPTTKVYDSRLKEFVEVRDMRVPMYMIDGVLRIVAPSSGEIDLEMVRDLVLFLRGHIFIKWATMDSYQAPMFYQAFRKAQMRSGVMSVDESIAPYSEYKLAIKDERIWLPPHAVLAKETREVELDQKKQKVDHPSSGSKDCCLTGDTEISLLNGTEVPIEKLVGMQPWVYASTHDGDVVPAQASHVWCTGMRSIYEVVLDNGEAIRCTGNHPLMLRDGSFLAAEKLSPGMQLMPLYRKLSETNAKSALNGYEQFLSNRTGKWLFTHQEVVKQELGFKYGKSLGGRLVAHHMDLNKRNNCPENFKIMEWHAHRELHQKLASVNLKRLWDNPVFAEASRKRASRLGKRTGTANMTRYNKSKEHRAVASRIGKVTIEHAIQAYRDNSYLIGSNNWHARKDITLSRIFEVGQSCKSLVHLYEKLKCSQKVVYRVLKENGLKPVDLTVRFGYRRRSFLNHKIVSVQRIGDGETYNMAVPNLQNFAIRAGVFVHNSDSVSGVVFMLHKKEARYGGVSSRGERGMTIDEKSRKGTDGVRVIRMRGGEEKKKRVVHRLIV